MTTRHEGDAEGTVPADLAGANAKPKSRTTRKLPAAAPAAQPNETAPAELGDETVHAPRVEPAPTIPRKNTLAVAIPRRPPEAGDAGRDIPAAAGTQVQHDEPRLVGASGGRPQPDGRLPYVDPAEPLPATDDVDQMDEADVFDEVEADDEWSIADQPTIYLTPRPQTPPRRVTPPLAEAPTAELPAPRIRRTLADATGMPRPSLGSRPNGPRSAPPASGTRRNGPPSAPTGYSRTRLASPEGEVISPAPPDGIEPAALPDPRLQRFQRLRERRLKRDAGGQDARDPRPVADVARQWWNDLAPGVRKGLSHQHEARASGVHPIPAYEPAPSSRLGDAFGRLAASARELGDRARAVAAPALKRIHAQTEQAAQALVHRIEGPAARQQAPLLGPGRIAVFFRQGVTVRQAHEALMDAHARPLRLIPRKHGFLAYVVPGSEAQVAATLRDHPHVDDVAYLEYDEFGNPIE
jgi:hypothetical protein